MWLLYKWLPARNRNSVSCEAFVGLSDYVPYHLQLIPLHRQVRWNKSLHICMCCQLAAIRDRLCFYFSRGWFRLANKAIIDPATTYNRYLHIYLDYATNRFAGFTRRLTDIVLTLRFASYIAEKRNDTTNQKISLIVLPMRSFNGTTFFKCYYPNWSQCIVTKS